ncbi:MAG: TPM domain-containing protein [Desulfocapsa sp.]|nr:TPM domain-containing protein [Desulfocapsa sp.]
MKTVSRSLCFRLLLLLLIPWSIFCPALGNALEVPPLTGRINDTAAMLSQQTVANLDTLLASLEVSDSTQLVVLTIPSLEGEVLEEYSLKVAETWGIGQKGHDNGALLLISRDDRKLRIEVGYGLEGTLTDLTAGRIINGVIVPNFKKGRFDQGISDGVQAMIQAVKGEFDASGVVASGKSKEFDPAGIIVMLFFAFSFIAKIFQRKKVAASVTGGIVAPVLGLLFLPQLGLWLLTLVPIGLLGGLVVASRAASTGSGGGFYMGSGGFGGSSGRFGGGFSGGGGGFGGGGASGGW